MNFNYEMTISRGPHGKIDFKFDPDQFQSAIREVEFKFNSENRFPTDKSSGKTGQVELTVCGVITDCNTAIETQKLASWSKDQSNIYREVKITVSTNEESAGENFRRTYHFDQMICVDYTEKFSAVEEESGTFRIVMAQAPTYRISDVMVERI